MRAVWLWPILGGLAATPFGVIAGVAITYAILAAAGVSEHQGRRGLLAAVYGVLPGFVSGFGIGYQAVSVTMTRQPVWSGAIAGAAAGLLLAVVLGIVGLISGIHWAEARGVSNYAGERAAWGLFYVAMPLAAIGGAAGFVAGRALAT